MELKDADRKSLSDFNAEGFKQLLREVESETALLEAQEKLHRLKNRPATRPTEPKRDHREEKIKNTMNGGGYYTKMAEDLEAELIKKRGGKDKLDKEDIDRIKNAYRQAAQFDEGQG